MQTSMHAAGCWNDHRPASQVNMTMHAVSLTLRSAGVRSAQPTLPAAKALTNVGFVLDYLEARDAETLVPVGTSRSGKIRLLVAARLGKTRLIDNVGV
jgi:pantothenate synthetase